MVLKIYKKSSAIILLITLFIYAPMTYGFSFLFSDTNGADLVTHQIGYDEFGVGGNKLIAVGIDNTSQFRDEMAISVQNTITVWNNLEATTNNLSFGGSNNVPAGAIDFESVLLHEMGHMLGLNHPNVGGQVAQADSNFTMSTEGGNGVFNFNDGADNIKGSGDDIRGDDVNLNYFRTSTNNPFAFDGNVFDSTTYSRDLADLPGGDTFSANADRDVATLFGLGADTTEASVQQGTFFDEAQRTLGHDDVAGIKYSQSGIDEIQGTADDYTYTLVFVGQVDPASVDVVIDFDNSVAFASAVSSGFIVGDHAFLQFSDIRFNDGFNWFFNDQLLPVPEPSTYVLLGLLALGFLGRKRFLANKKEKQS